MEGNQVLLVLLKLLNELINKINNAIARVINIIEKTTVGYFKHKQRKKELGLKDKRIIKSDKFELEIARNLKKNLTFRERKLKEKIQESKFKLDSYKLEMQGKLDKLEKEIRKSQVSLENAKDNISKEMIEIELFKNLKNKTDFEKQVNKNLLEETQKNSSLEYEYKHLLDNIKICDKAIDGFASNRERDMTESMRTNFDNLIKEEGSKYSKEKDLNESKDLNKQKEKSINIKDDEFMKEYIEKQRRKSLAKEKEKEVSLER